MMAPPEIKGFVGLRTTTYLGDVIITIPHEPREAPVSYFLQPKEVSGLFWLVYVWGRYLFGEAPLIDVKSAGDSKNPVILAVLTYIVNIIYDKITALIFP
jgi:hypothetical protein